MKPCPACFGACTGNKEIITPKAKTVFTLQRLPGLQLEIRCIHADFILPFFSKGNNYIRSIHVSKISIYVSIIFCCFAECRKIKILIQFLCIPPTEVLRPAAGKATTQDMFMNGFNLVPWKGKAFYDCGLENAHSNHRTFPDKIFLLSETT